MKPLIIYHDHCTDGFAAAYCAWLKFGETAEYLPMSYNSEFDVSAVTKRDVYIMDFSFPKDVMEKIFTLADHTTWLDHHKTAFEAFGIEGSSWALSDSSRMFIRLDNNKSGAMLAWENFFPLMAVPGLIARIDDRDRWVFQFKDSKAMHEGLQAQKPWTFEQWQEYNMYEGGSISSLVELGESLLKKMDNEVTRAAKQSKVVRINDPHTDHNEMPYWEGRAVNYTAHASEIGNKLADMSGGFGMVYYITADGSVAVSLRSIGDYDVSRIAKLYGGGGHKNASGCTMTIAQLLEIIQ